MKKETIKINGNKLISKVRVCLDNKTISFKNKKKEYYKKKCRKKIIY